MLHRVLGRLSRWRRSLGLGLVALILALGVGGLPWMQAPTVAQVTLKDIQGHWAEACITKLADKQILRGYPDGTFRPDEAVTRAAFAAMVAQAFPQIAPVRSAPSFRDVSSTFWAATVIQKVYRAGFLSGFPDGTFQPNESITRAQAWTAIASGLKWQPQQSTVPTLALFKDAGDIPAYAKSAIAAATEKQAVVNYPSIKLLQPLRAANRAELAALLCQTLPDTVGLIAEQYVPQRQPITQKEIRGVWLTNIDSDVLFDADRLKAALQDLSQQGFNTVYPTVWNWGYTLYPSDVMQATIGLKLDPRPAGLQNRDILKEITTEAHRLGMAVIPWFEFGFMAPADSELAKQHPDWLTQNPSGKTTWLEGQDVRVWLNPFAAPVQKLVLDLVQEIASRYDIDGIQFDDHLGLPVEFGYDSVTTALYKQEHNNQAPPSTVSEASWIRWRADKITAVMEQVFRTVKQAKPQAIVALSPNPYSFAYNQSLQDWHAWEQQGLIEELIVQIYKDSLSGFINELISPELLVARGHIPTGIGILSGLKGKQVAMNQIEEQVQAVRDRGYAGVSLFFYETLWNVTGESPTLRKQAFKQMFTPTVPRPRVGAL